MNILSILDELAATASTNAKEAILRRERGNELLRAVFAAAYNPTITYGIKQIPVQKKHDGMESLNTIFPRLNCLARREYTGNAAIEYLTGMLKGLNGDDAVVLERIIQRDLRCGTSDTLAARVWPGIVPTFDVMLAHSDISNIKYPAYAQIKSDGARCHMTRIGNTAIAFSRNGKEIMLHNVFNKNICELVKDGETLDGELMVMRDGKILDRKTGNGIVNKAVKGTISESEAAELIFVTWDIVDFTSTIPYSERIERLTKEGMAAEGGMIFVMHTSVVNSEEEAIAFYKECRKAGEEGAMMKNMDSVWVPKRSKDIGKMKAIEVADLRVIAWYKGEAGKQYENALGGYTCQSECGKLTVNVGGGYSQEYRFQDHSVFDAMLGSIIEVTYNEVIQDKKTKNYSLFLPRVDSDTDWLRFDKDVANKLEELK